MLVLEAAATAGGGVRTAELTLPGFRHDVCSAIHPLGLGSPFLPTLPLERHGLEWIQPPAPLAHPFDDGTAVLLERSRRGDSARARGRRGRLPRPHGSRSLTDADDLLGRDPRPAAGTPASRAARPLRPARRSCRPTASRAGGSQASAPAPSSRGSQRTRCCRSPARRAPGFGLVLGLLGHHVGWPLPEGGSQSLAEALAACLRSLGGELELGRRVESLAELPPAARCAPRRHAAAAAPARAAAACRPATAAASQGFRYGPGAFKLDLALDGPIPWRAPSAPARPPCTSAGRSRRSPRPRPAWPPAAYTGAALRPARAAEPLRSDPGAGRQAHASGPTATCRTDRSVDMTERIEAQIERFAPGFRDRLSSRGTCSGPQELERYNANYVGGDINGGLQDLRQLFTRPDGDGSSRTRHRCPGFSCARRPRRRAEGSTACAATGRRRRRCGSSAGKP